MNSGALRGFSQQTESGTVLSADDNGNIGLRTITIPEPPVVTPVDPTPSGVVAPFAGSSAPSGWLICDGAYYAKADYASLDVVLSNSGTYPYGQTNSSGVAATGASATHFKVPNLQQRFPMGKASAGTGSALGATGGSIDHGHSHSHTPSVTIASALSHTHSFSYSTTTGTPANGNAAASGTGNNAGGQHDHSVSGSGTSGSSGSHGHSVSSASTDSQSGTAGNPPYITFNYIIKT